MKQQGRVSNAAASVIQLPEKRARPPRDMPPDQAELWKKIVATKPASWFTADCLPVLEQYCRHVTTAALLEKQIAAWTTDDDLKLFIKLLQLRDRETGNITRLATSLRLTPQSRIKAETAHTQAAAMGDAEKPW